VLGVGNLELLLILVENSPKKHKVIFGSAGELHLLCGCLLLELCLGLFASFENGWNMNNELKGKGCFNGLIVAIVAVLIVWHGEWMKLLTGWLTLEVLKFNRRSQRQSSACVHQISDSVSK
jgi:hypothetical protein